MKKLFEHEIETYLPFENFCIELDTVLEIHKIKQNNAYIISMCLFVDNDDRTNFNEHYKYNSSYKRIFINDFEAFNPMHELIVKINTYISSNIEGKLIDIKNLKRKIIEIKRDLTNLFDKSFSVIEE